MFGTSDYILQNTFQNTNGPADRAQYVLGLYRRALLSGRMGRIIAVLSGHANHLSDLESVQASLSERNQRYIGSRTVAISQIVGSEGRTHDFDRSFNPLDERSRDRWMSVASARQNGVALPAVELIQIGQNYFVRDGHHRISVAHAFGEEYIDAIVTVA
jgi:hypothetical protein